MTKIFVRLVHIGNDERSFFEKFTWKPEFKPQFSETFCIDLDNELHFQCRHFSYYSEKIHYDGEGKPTKIIESEPATEPYTIIKFSSDLIFYLFRKADHHGSLSTEWFNTKMLDYEVTPDGEYHYKPAPEGTEKQVLVEENYNSLEHPLVLLVAEGMFHIAIEAKCETTFDHVDKMLLEYQYPVDKNLSPEKKIEIDGNRAKLETALAEQEARRTARLVEAKGVEQAQWNPNHTEKDSFKERLDALLAKIDSKCRIVFPNVIINAAYTIYEEMRKNIKNDEAFKSLSGKEQTNYINLIESVSKVISTFHSSFHEENKEEYADELKKLSALASELKGHRSTGEIIAGAILIFIGAVLTAAAAITALVSAGTLSVPAAVAGYAGLSLFATGAAAIGCSTLTLAGASIGVGGAALITGIGLTVHGGSRTGVADAAAELADIAEKQQKMRLP